MSGDDRFPDPFPGQGSPPSERGDRRQESEPDPFPRSGGAFTQGWSAGSGPRQGGDPSLERTQVSPPVGVSGSFSQQDPYGAPRPDPYQGSSSEPQYGQASTQLFGQTPYGRGDSYGHQHQDPDPFGVPRRGNRSGDDAATGPNRKIIITALIVTVLIAIGTGTFFGMFRSDSSETAATTLPTPSASTADASTPSPPSTAPSTSAAKKTTDDPGMKTPTGFVDAPWNWEGMDFGLVTAVSAQGAGAVITVDRAQFLVGSDATSYYAEHPELEPLDYAVVNETTSSLQFLVTEDSLLYGQYLLGDGNTVRTTRISMDQLLDRGGDVVSDGQQISVWLYHTSGEDGPVVYLAEQFIP
jgi:hypothetical protein